MLIADTKSEYDTVVFALDMIRKAKIQQYAINVPKAGDSEDK